MGPMASVREVHMESKAAFWQHSTAYTGSMTWCFRLAEYARAGPFFVFLGLRAQP